MGSEIDDALKIARNLRNSILTNSGKIENHLRGIFTVAQILGRTKDLEWSRSELSGYSKVPSSRVVPVRIHINDVLVKGENSEFYEYCLPTGIPKLIELMKSTKDTEIHFALEESDKKYIANTPNIILKGKCTIRVNTADVAHIISSTELELLERLNSMISEITYGKIPQGIFKRFQTKVNDKLIESNPEAISELNISYESLGKSEDPERIAHVAFACRRLVQVIADKLFPAQDGQTYKMKDETEREIGGKHFLNRLEAYVDLIDSPNRKYLIKEIKLLRDLLNEIPESANKGVHLNIKNLDAERLVLYSYMILGDIIMEESKKKI